MMAAHAPPLSPSDDQLSAEQRRLLDRSLGGNNTLFLSGPAGVGKTTVGTAWLRRLLRERVPSYEVLVLTPQRTLLTPYLNVLRSPELPPTGVVDTLTIGGLARRMVDLFWPLVAERAGFDHPEQPPNFLTLETAQYYMARIADPLIDAGAFEEVTVERNRLLSQILDNLNKAALVGLDYRRVGERLRAAWTGASARAAVYERAQQCANEFRALCLAQNLLDFSLQIEVFVNHLLELPWTHGDTFMTRFTRYRHLIVDNVEEDNPVTHDLLYRWLADCDSALLIYDQDAGYRIFLGADPDSGFRLRDRCRQQAELHRSFVASPSVQHLGYEMARSLRQTPSPIVDQDADLRQALVINESGLRFHTQMLDWAADEIAELVHERAVPPGQIAVVAPFLSDALRFSLTDRLARRGIPARSHRPSRALREEPATRCLLTLAALAHPDWNRLPLSSDVVHALALAIQDLDLVRSQLLTDIVYRPQNVSSPPKEGKGASTGPEAPSAALNPFSELKIGVQERIGYQVGNRYDILREWLFSERADAPIDHFLSRLFGELLSQPGFGFHGDFDAGRITAQLIESAQKFRRVADPPPSGESEAAAPPIGLEYIRMVERGVIAAQYVPAWQSIQEEEEAVLLAPAYTFLMRNRPVDYQFWLNVGSVGWWERLFQPLTHPYVLTRHWRHGEAWTDADEAEAQTQALHRLVQGLIRRCRVQIYLGFSELGEQGYEQQGPLLKAVQSTLRRQR